MTIEKKEGSVTEQETPKVDDQKQETIEEITARIKAEVSAEVEGKYKNEISTRDTKITQYQKDLKARMTEEERIKTQADEERKEWLTDISNIAAESIGLDEKHASLIKGNSKEEIKQTADLIKSLKDTITKDFEKQIKALTEELNIYKANGVHPKAGSPTIGTKTEFTREELKDPANRKLYNGTTGAYIKNE